MELLLLLMKSRNTTEKSYLSHRTSSITWTTSTKNTTNKNNIKNFRILLEETNIIPCLLKLLDTNLTKDIQELILIGFIDIFENLEGCNEDEDEDFYESVKNEFIANGGDRCIEQMVGSPNSVIRDLAKELLIRYLDVQEFDEDIFKQAIPNDKMQF
mmetsp:Transcript_6588/g.5681  ORF Transcript_6588/g.5681 Transcript_6588/m.5681 type:complete len:157 (+) Transcript_6588:121-591(+)